MGSTVKPLMVPWDFTQVAEYALEHAVKIAKIDGNPIYLAHIAKKKEEEGKLKGILDVYAVEAFKKYSIKPKTIVRQGNIFTSIGEIADEIDAEMVVMGTHGMKGMQKLTGSWALKVIVSSKVPFVVVQSPPENNNFEDIVLPIDFRKEDKEKLNWIVYLYKHFNSKIHIIKPKKSDKRLVKGLNANIAFARKILEQKHVKFDMIIAEGKKSFAKETIEYAVKINAHMIVTMTTKNIGLADYVMGADEQYIIANSAKIPVMCINPRIGISTGGFTAMGG
ncbi:MAG: universal stress protein [Marinilabiliales bacterium]|nr:MAG: universal stress protein [Marinilabiliales bacterium]